MIKLNFSLMENPIEIKNGTFLVIEDPKAFAHVVELLYAYSEVDDLKLFDTKQKNLKPAELFLMSDIFTYDFNSSNLIKLIHSDLATQFNQEVELKSELEQTIERVREIVQEQLIEHELDLSIGELSQMMLFKALGIKLNMEGKTIFEKILETTQIYKYLSSKRLLVFINLCSYLSNQDLEELLRYIDLLHVDVLFVEPRSQQGQNQYILDEDYFLITEKHR